MLYKANGHTFKIGCRKNSSKKRADSIQQIVIKLYGLSNMKTNLLFSSQQEKKTIPKLYRKKPYLNTEKKSTYREQLFLYTNNYISKKELKQTTPFTIVSKNKFSNKFNQGGKRAVY